jgi:hypothetical protein
MSYRARQIVALVLLVAVASAYGRISRDWSFGTFYPVLLGIAAVCVISALLWTEVGPGEESPHHRPR